MSEDLDEQLYGALARLEKRHRREQSEKGDPLVSVMQLQEISKKLDEIIDRLERLEQRQSAGLERMEARQKAGLEGIEKAVGPTVGSFASPE